MSKAAPNESNEKENHRDNRLAEYAIRATIQPEDVEPKLKEDQVKALNKLYVNMQEKFTEMPKELVSNYNTLEPTARAQLNDKALNSEYNKLGEDEKKAIDSITKEQHSQMRNITAVELTKHLDPEHHRLQDIDQAYNNYKNNPDNKGVSEKEQKNIQDNKEFFKQNPALADKINLDDDNPLAVPTAKTPPAKQVTHRSSGGKSKSTNKQPTQSEKNDKSDEKKPRGLMSTFAGLLDTIIKKVIEVVDYALGEKPKDDRYTTTSEELQAGAAKHKAQQAHKSPDKSNDIEMTTFSPTPSQAAKQPERDTTTQPPSPEKASPSSPDLSTLEAVRDFHAKGGKLPPATRADEAAVLTLPDVPTNPITPQKPDKSVASALHPAKKELPSAAPKSPSPQAPDADDLKMARMKSELDKMEAEEKRLAQLALKKKSDIAAYVNQEIDKMTPKPRLDNTLANLRTKYTSAGEKLAIAAQTAAIRNNAETQSPPSTHVTAPTPPHNSKARSTGPGKGGTPTLP